jgi:hypothetical protein
MQKQSGQKLLASCVFGIPKGDFLPNAWLTKHTHAYTHSKPIALI